jgi:hypothetical protein
MPSCITPSAAVWRRIFGEPAVEKLLPVIVTLLFNIIIVIIMCGCPGSFLRKKKCGCPFPLGVHGQTCPRRDIEVSGVFISVAAAAAFVCFSPIEIQQKNGAVPW